MSHHLAVDIGGTFTDFVLTDTASGEVRIEKAPSRPDQLERHFFEVVDAADLGAIRRAMVDVAEHADQDPRPAVEPAAAG